MSLLKVIRQQLGQSVTPANNFTLDASADDGTMKLVKGPSTNVLTVDAAGKIKAPQGYGDVLGSGQTWQSMLGVGGRASGVPITNSTGKPIMVNICSTTYIVSVVVDGVTVMGTLTSNIYYASFVVPVGSVYTVTYGAGTQTWTELR